MAIGRAVVKALDDNNFVLCNVKGCDVAGHDADPDAKLQMIERMDKMVGMCVDAVDEQTYIILTADHSTPVAVQDHSGDPVPIAFWGPGVRTDPVQAFDERSVVGGGLLRIRGVDIMNILTNLMGVQEKFGA